MRKDPGLNGDLDRLPQLSWLLFLRAFDLAEDNRKAIEADSFRPAIVEPYRWRDWGADSDYTGEELLKFVNAELLPYLRGLEGTREGTNAMCCRRCLRRFTTGCFPATYYVT